MKNRNEKKRKTEIMYIQSVGRSGWQCVCIFRFRNGYLSHFWQENEGEREWICNVEREKRRKGKEEKGGGRNMWRLKDGREIPGGLGSLESSAIWRRFELGTGFFSFFCFLICRKFCLEQFLWKTNR